MVAPSLIDKNQKSNIIERFSNSFRFNVFKLNLKKKKIIFTKRVSLFFMDLLGIDRNKKKEISKLYFIITEN